MSSGCSAVLLALAVSAAVSGCRWFDAQAPADLAVAGAAPVSGIPVGPTPGPGSGPPLPSNPYGGDPVARVSASESALHLEAETIWRYWLRKLWTFCASLSGVRTPMTNGLPVR